jgi:hypothetical protein
MADTPQPDPQTFALCAGDTGRVDLFSPPHLQVGEIDTVSYHPMVDPSLCTNSYIGG